MNLTTIYNKYLAIIEEHNDTYFGKINNTTYFSFNIDYSGTDDSLHWFLNEEDNTHEKEENKKKYKRFVLSFKPEDEANLIIALDYVIEETINGKKEPKIHRSGFEYCFSLVNEETNNSVYKFDNNSTFISQDYDNFEYSEESISFIIDNLNFDKKELKDMYNLKFDYEIPVNGLINFLINSIDSIKTFEYKDNIKHKPSLK